MNTDQIAYFIDIAKTGSINTTAKRMFSSQQAVSDAIKRMEQELGCTILERSKRGVSLTDDGKYVLQRCPNRKGHIPTKKEKENQKKFIKQWKKRKKDAEVPKDVIEALKELCIFDWEQCP